MSSPLRPDVGLERDERKLEAVGDLAVALALGDGRRDARAGRCGLRGRRSALARRFRCGWLGLLGGTVSEQLHPLDLVRVGGDQAHRPAEHQLQRPPDGLFLGGGTGDQQAVVVEPQWRDPERPGQRRVDG